MRSYPRNSAIYLLLVGIALTLLFPSAAQAKLTKFVIDKSRPRIP